MGLGVGFVIGCIAWYWVNGKLHFSSQGWSAGSGSSSSVGAWIGFIEFLMRNELRSVRFWECKFNYGALKWVLLDVCFHHSKVCSVEKIRSSAGPFPFHTNLPIATSHRKEFLCDTRFQTRPPQNMRSIFLSLSQPLLFSSPRRWSCCSWRVTALQVWLEQPLYVCDCLCMAAIFN